MTAAAELLAAQYDYLITNVPYLGKGWMNNRLATYCEETFQNSKSDLATCFIDRSMQFCSSGGVSALVTPQSWLYINPYRRFRERLLEGCDWKVLACLGVRSFEEVTGEIVNVNLSILCNTRPSGHFAGMDVSWCVSAIAKALCLKEGVVRVVHQADQLLNPDYRISLEQTEETKLLGDYADSYKGLATGDLNRFILKMWELRLPKRGWEFVQGSVQATMFFAGREHVLLWEEKAGALYDFVCQKLGPSGVGAWLRGERAWSKWGVAISQMRGLRCSVYGGNLFDENTAAIIPKDDSFYSAIWAFCSSSQYKKFVKMVDNSSLKIPSLTLLKVSFDLSYWMGVAQRQYPYGLPKPYSNDPTQWIFHGHPCGSVI